MSRGTIFRLVDGKLVAAEPGRSKAAQLIEDLAHNAWLMSGMWSDLERRARSNWGPGKLIERLSDAKRALLKTLSSDDIAEVNPPPTFQERRPMGWGRASNWTFKK